VVYNGRVVEGSRVDPLNAKMAGFRKAHGGEAVAGNVVRLEGVGGKLGGLLTVSPRLRHRVTAVEKDAILS
jgi:hypothetical protein